MLLRRRQRTGLEQDQNAALLAACYMGRGEEALNLLALGAAHDYVGEFCEEGVGFRQRAPDLTPLIAAANSGCLLAAQGVLAVFAEQRQSPRATAIMENGCHALTLAAAAGNCPLVELMLDACPWWLEDHGQLDLWQEDVPFEKFGSPLAHAARRGHPECVELLLRRGADMEASVGYDSMPPCRCTALFRATETFEGTVDLLLRRGADANRTCPCHGPPLFYALWPRLRHRFIERDSVDKQAIFSLLRHGADVNAQWSLGDWSESDEESEEDVEEYEVESPFGVVAEEIYMLGPNSGRLFELAELLIMTGAQWWRFTQPPSEYFDRFSLVSHRRRAGLTKASAAAAVSAAVAALPRPALRSPESSRRDVSAATRRAITRFYKGRQLYAPLEVELLAEAEAHLACAEAALAELSSHMVSFLSLVKPGASRGWDCWLAVQACALRQPWLEEKETAKRAAEEARARVQSAEAASRLELNDPERPVLLEARAAAASGELEAASYPTEILAQM
jgi:hypothetical protein